MWFDGIRQPNTLYVASVSRGKDSTAMLRAIQIMGWPLDAICSVDIWFDDETPAELPPMVSFKDKWDAKCLAMFSVPVTRLRATKRETYTSYFYRNRKYGKFTGAYVGFPMQRGSWCKKLKYEQVDLCGDLLLQGYSAERERFSDDRPDNDQNISFVYYIGIAADEPLRIERHMPNKDKVMPLVQIGWDEALCGLEATYMDMLSPTYDGSFRDGCWFCHNQSVGQLRNLRKNYPELWEKLMKLDLDSPVTFHADGHTVHDFDKRFQWEDDGFLQSGKRFRWEDIDEPQMNIWQTEVIV